MRPFRTQATGEGQASDGRALSEEGGTVASTETIDPRIERLKDQLTNPGLSEADVSRIQRQIEILQQEG